MCYHLWVEVCDVTQPQRHRWAVVSGKSVKEILDRLCELWCQLTKDTLTTVHLATTITFFIELLELAVCRSSPSFHLKLNCLRHRPYFV